MKIKLFLIKHKTGKFPTICNMKHLNVMINQRNLRGMAITMDMDGEECARN
jgi:hypothetical protein